MSPDTLKKSVRTLAVCPCPFDDVEREVNLRDSFDLRWADTLSGHTRELSGGHAPPFRGACVRSVRVEFRPEDALHGRESSAVLGATSDKQSLGESGAGSPWTAVKSLQYRLLFASAQLAYGVGMASCPRSVHAGGGR